jgi:hypothetical protein
MRLLVDHRAPRVLVNPHTGPRADRALMSDTIQQTVPIPVQVRTSTAFRSSECPLRGQEQVIRSIRAPRTTDTLQTVDGGCHRLGFGSAEPTSEAKAGVG